MAQPPWLAHGAWNASTLAPVMAELMAGIVGADGVRGNVLAWDVVNEPICDDGHCAADNSSVFKPNTWWPTLGNGYVEAALRLARAADPDALLFINEYGAEDMGAKSDRMYGVVRDLKARGVPLDGVGLQAHSSIHGYANATQVAQNIARLGALGLQVHVTELDVECPPKYCNASDPDDPGFATQARIYGDLLEACLNNTGVCTAFSTWGFTDRYSWTNQWCLGSDCQSLPFDRNYSAKSAFFEMLAVLNRQ
jgi:endo-1,4-beta-xylanase